MNASGVETALTGRVKWFNDLRGFGFITADGAAENAAEYFVHFSEIQSPQRFKSLNEGERVMFEVGACANGRIVAVRVKRMEISHEAAK